MVVTARRRSLGDVEADHIRRCFRGNRAQHNNRCSGGHVGALIQIEGGTMTALTIRFLSLLLTSLLVGTMFGIWLGFNPAGLTAAIYVEMQQNAIRALNTSLPALGVVCILLTVVLAVLTKNDKRGSYLLIAAALCLIAAGLITRLANQPINAQVMTWAAQAPPTNWTEMRDTWWHWHILRTIAGIVALALALLAALGHHERSDCSHAA